MSDDLELFHLIAQPESAAVRRRLVESGLIDRVAMRNVAFESHQQALAGRGGAQTPALWDGQTLHQGQAAVLAAIERLAGAR